MVRRSRENLPCHRQKMLNWQKLLPLGWVGPDVPFCGVVEGPNINLMFQLWDARKRRISQNRQMILKQLRRFIARKTGVILHGFPAKLCCGVTYSIF